MKNRVIISLIFVVPVLVYFLLLSFNPNLAVEESVQAMTDMPKVIVFSTPMCGECRKMSPVVEKVKSNYDGTVEIIKINAAESKSANLVRKHGIYLVPTTLFIDKNGNVLTRAEGAMSFEEFDSLIQSLLK